MRYKKALKDKYFSRLLDLCRKLLVLHLAGDCLDPPLREKVLADGLKTMAELQADLD